VAIVATFVLHLTLARGNGPVTRGVTGLLEPFVRLGAGINERASGVWLSMFEGERLRAENEALRGELNEARLRAAVEHSELTLIELTERVSTNLPTAGTELITVPVLSSAGPRDRQVLWLGMGTREGLAPGMAVLGPETVIGLIEKCTEGMSLVRLVTDRRSTWGAEVTGLGELGLLVGTGSGDTVELHFSRTVTEAEAGQIVTTSGLAGSIAPAALRFGEIESLGRNRKSEPMAVVRLPGDPSKLRTVWVLPERRISVDGLRP
jgi:rod shape-determining protein MreC